MYLCDYQMMEGCCYQLFVDLDHLSFIGIVMWFNCYVLIVPFYYNDLTYVMLWLCHVICHYLCCIDLMIWLVSVCHVFSFYWSVLTEYTHTYIYLNSNISFSKRKQWPKLLFLNSVSTKYFVNAFVYLHDLLSDWQLEPILCPVSALEYDKLLLIVEPIWCSPHWNAINWSRVKSLKAL